ncbi:MAG TPA: transcriptional repressor LexA [Anaeromyxobacter sp.]|nr:transcriptional repressor LexA [Anaeromyxobacter sp.]
MDGLTDRQLEVLRFIARQIEDAGYPPTIREIGEALDIRSTNGVNDHLKALERKGFLSRDPVKSRALIPTDQARETLGVVRQAHHERGDGAPPRSNVIPFAKGAPRASARLVEVPIVGRVAAGQPILAQERIEDTVQVDAFLLGTNKKVYGLRVQGDSMIGDGILPGDYVFVKKQLHAEDGEIVVAMIDDEATVKRVYFEGDRVRFQPSNPRMAPIYVRDSDFRSTMILGVVVGVYRKLA